MDLPNDINRQVDEYRDNYIITDIYYGNKAVNEAKKVFFPNNKKKADKWIERWSKDERKKAVYFTYLMKKNKYIYIYAKFIIGEGERLSVLGQKGPKITSSLLLKKF